MIWARIVAILAILGALFAGYKYVQHTGYEKCRAEMQADSLKLALAYAERVKKAEEERDANQTTIDRLTAESHRVRVHIPICPSVASTQNQNGEAGVLSQRVDESFARLQERTTELIKRCDELNLDAIKANSSFAQK